MTEVMDSVEVSEATFDYLVSIDPTALDPQSRMMALMDELVTTVLEARSPEAVAQAQSELRGVVKCLEIITCGSTDDLRAAAQYRYDNKPPRTVDVVSVTKPVKKKRARK